MEKDWEWVQWAMEEAHYHPEKSRMVIVRGAARSFERRSQEREPTDQAVEERAQAWLTLNIEGIRDWLLYRGALDAVGCKDPPETYSLFIRELETGSLRYRRGIGGKGLKRLREMFGVTIVVA